MLAAAQQKPPNPVPGKTQTGVVTKMLENFGFIDDSIFFPLSVIKGVNVKIGDKVYYECTYSKSLPFNWNATLVQLVPNSAGSQSGSSGGGHSSVPPHGSSYESHGKLPPPQGQQAAANQHSNQYAMHHKPSSQPPAQSAAASHQSGNYSMPQHNPYQPQPGSNASNNNYYHPQAKAPQPFPNQPYPPSAYGGHSGPHGQSGPPQGQQQPKSAPQQAPPGQQSHQAPPPFPDLAKVQQAVAAAAQLAQYYPPNQGAPGSAVSGPPGGPNALPGGSHPPQSNQPGGHGQPPAGPYGQIQYTSTPGSAFISAPQQYNPQQTGPPKQQLPPGPQGPPNRGGPPGGPPPPGVGGSGGRWGDQDNRQYDPRRPLGGPGPHGHGPRDNGPGPHGPGPRDIGPGPHGPGPRDIGTGPGGRFEGPPGGGRGPKSRFNDNDRFGQSIPIPPPPPPPPQPQNQPQINDEPPPHNRFGPPPPQNEMYRPMPARDEFGRDLRKDDSRFGGPRDAALQSGPPPGRGGSDKERDSFRDRTDSRDREKDSDSISGSSVAREKDHPRGGGRNDRPERRRDRDRGNRGRGPSGPVIDKKRSISPASVASSSGGGGRGDSARNALPGTSKRRYEPCNIPKNMILRNRYSASELKNRISSSVHIPSDLKEVLYNIDADLDLLDIPKPLVYKILSLEKEKDSKLKDSKDSKEKGLGKAATTPSKPIESKEVKILSSTEESKETDSVEAKKDAESSETKQSTTQEQSVPEEDKSKETAESQTTTEPSSEGPDEETEPKDMEIDDESVSGDNSSVLIETNVPLEAVSQAKKSFSETSQSNETNQSKSQQQEGKSHKDHKYNVKVLLISLPTLAEMYEKLFGSDFDNTNSSSSKNRVTHFNKLFSLLVFRNADNGYSLIGGKWIPEKDGTLPGCGEDAPNLIATAIRVVHEQTGLNLSTCRQWKVFSTFIYNRDTHLDPNNASYEVTKIYFPDIWSSMDTIYAPLESKEDIVESTTEVRQQELPTETETVLSTVEDLPQVDTIVEEAEEAVEENTSDLVSNDTASNDVDMLNEDKDSQQSAEPEDTPSREYLEDILDNINDMKVADLKNELEKLNQKIDGRPRKDQLAQRLREYVKEQLELINNKTAEKPQVLPNEEMEIQEVPEQSAFNETTIIDSQISQNGLSSTEESTSEIVSSEAPKRKLNTEETLPEEAGASESKKTKIEEKDDSLNANTEKEITEKIPLSAVGSNVKVKGHHLSVLSLSNALSPHRFDQFELIVAAELIRDSLSVHFARYILSTLIHNYHSLKSLSASSSLPTDKHRVLAVNYVHFAFAFFDKGHCGHMPSDDLLSLLNSTGYALSRKVLTGLTTANGSDRIQYREYQPPSALVDRVLHYPSISSLTSSSVNASDATEGVLIVERNSTQYNVDELIKQSEVDQKVKVRLNEDLLSSTSKIGHLEQTILELETKQKKMSAATGRQNDELCAVKRERDQLKNKYEQLRKTMEKTLSSLSEALKQNQPLSAPNTVQSTVATESTSNQVNENSS